VSDSRLRVAAVGYLNARPLYEGLDREPASQRMRLDCAIPSEVVRRIAESALLPRQARCPMVDAELPVLLIMRLARRDGRDGGIGWAARLRGSRRVVIPVLVLCRGAAGCRTMGL